MKIKEKNRNIRYNKNFRNNQNYIISDIDKKFIIYNFFEKKESHVLVTLNILSFVLLPPIWFLFYVLGYDILNIYLNYIVLTVILIFIWWIVIFTLYSILLIKNYSFVMKFIKKYRFIFKKKPSWILLKKNSSWKYKEILHYFLNNSNNWELLKKSKIDIKNDFTYIKK